MNAKDMQISEQRQQEIALSAGIRRQVTEAQKRPEAVVMEVTPGKTPFVTIIIGKYAARRSLCSAVVVQPFEEGWEIESLPE